MENHGDNMQGSQVGVCHQFECGPFALFCGCLFWICGCTIVTQHFFATYVRTRSSLSGVRLGWASFSLAALAQVKATNSFEAGLAAVYYPCEFLTALCLWPCSPCLQCYWPHNILLVVPWVVRIWSPSSQSSDKVWVNFYSLNFVTWINCPPVDVWWLWDTGTGRLPKRWE